MTTNGGERLLLNVSPLRIDHYFLRSVQKEDADSIHALINDWNVARMLSNSPFPYPKDQLNKWIDVITKQISKGEAYHFSIIDEASADKKLVGCIGLRIDKANRCAKIGYWIGQKFWKQGIAKKALQRISSWALATLDIDYLYATSAKDNTASIKVLSNCGYHQYGTGKEKFIARGIEEPVIHFALQREDICKQNANTTPVSNNSSKPILLVVAAALIDVEGRLLLAKRPEGKAMAGLWEFPGGKVEPGESPEAALIRELKEELGIDVSRSCLAPFTFISYSYEEFHLMMPLYVCHRWQNTPEPKEGQQALAWVKAQDLDKYLVMEADRPMIPFLKDLLF